MPTSTMRTTCLINSFNYRDYVIEAVESALHQTCAFDQILVVDDGSTDGSQELLKRLFEQEPRVQVIRKENGGQLSCFNHAIPLVTGDLLFFLDADDRYRPDYLATALTYYARTSADFLIAGLEEYGSNKRGANSLTRDTDLGISVLSTLFEKTWVGAPTSGLSMRTPLAQRILPFPFEAEWRIQADMVLVFAASILGARKYAVGKALVERRVHGANLYYGKRFDCMTIMRRSLALNRLLAWYAEEAGYYPADLPRLLAVEFGTHERPTIREYRRYLRMSRRLPLRLATRANHVFSITAHMLRTLCARSSAALTPAKSDPRQRRAA
jgi:glycosyltransferase involved in cell wall biosynthesis